jgi:DNA invertase Pin-like site-specific DNA recombinase
MRNASKTLPLAGPLPLRVALYARVSTVRQAEADLSIPDQVRQAEAWCERQGHELVRQYIEPGASGTDETRPVFSEMLSDAKASLKPFDIILVHSFSRFARDNFTYAIAKLALNKAGVVVQSISQPLNDDSTGQMVESILVAFDAYTSKEISKHTARGMKENARQGFWNGSRPPFGYAACAADCEATWRRRSKRGPKRPFWRSCPGREILAFGSIVVGALFRRSLRVAFGIGRSGRSVTFVALLVITRSHTGLPDA